MDRIIGTLPVMMILAFGAIWGTDSGGWFSASQSDSQVELQASGEFGSWSDSQLQQRKSARPGRNPQTGKPIKIDAKRVASFGVPKKP